jgi:hypothetical protein
MASTKADPKSPNQVTAENLVERLIAVRTMCGEIDQRGGILGVLRDAQADEAQRKQVCAAIDASWKSLRSYVQHIGDDRRARGQAVPLCWLPGDGGTS